MIRGIKFVSIPVDDQERALAFYTEKLGLRIATDQPFDGKQRWLELTIPGAETGVVLFSMNGGPEPGTFMNLSLWTDDVVTTAKALKERGVEFVSEPKKESWGTSAIFKDSEGNRFVLSSR